jgi:hypothetical protein
MDERKVRPLKRAVIKEEYIMITGDMMEAVILNQMIYWSKRVNDYDGFISEENTRRAQEDKSSSALTLLHGWIHKSAAELKDEIMSSDSPKTIMRKLDSLVKKGFLDRRNNPDHPYDRIYQYRVNFLVVIDALNKYGYPLDGFKVEYQPQTAEGTDSVLTEDSPKQPKGQTDLTKGQFDVCKGQNDEWKGQGENCKGHDVPAIPESTSEITSEITPSSPPYPQKGQKRKKMDDRTRVVPEILTAIGIDKLRHIDMINLIRSLVSDLLLTGEVGRNQFRLNDVEKAIRNLTADEIDGVIDRFTEQGEKGRIPCPDDYLKTCFLHAGQAAEYKALASKSGSEGIHNGNPSFNVDDYVELQMQLLHREGEN